MQILENTVLGLRSATILYQSPDKQLSVTIFPMVHVGEEQFYRDVDADAFSHDVVLVEGIRSALSRHLTRSYRWIRLEKLGLVLQPRPPSQSDVHARIVRADLSAEEFAVEWRRVPLWLRLAVLIAVPIVGLTLRLTATRKTIANNLEMEDRLSSGEIMTLNPQLAALRQGILHSRDARLVECLGAELDRPHEAPCRIAVLFGAGHVRAVLTELRQRGFVAGRAPWRTIFSY